MRSIPFIGSCAVHCLVHSTVKQAGFEFQTKSQEHNTIRGRKNYNKDIIIMFLGPNIVFVTICDYKFAKDYV